MAGPATRATDSEGAGGAGEVALAPAVAGAGEELAIHSEPLY